MSDYLAINSNERWCFRRDDDGGVDITLQRQAAGRWFSVDWFRRDDCPTPAAHYANFRRKFADDSDYRNQFRLEEQIMTHEQNTNGHEPAGFTEAPASATARVISPQGFEWLVTTRDAKVSALLDKMTYLENYLLDRNWQPANGGGRGSAGASSAPSGDAPVCEFHGPMKQSTKAPGSWFCPSKMGNGEYCKSKA